MRQTGTRLGDIKGGKEGDKYSSYGRTAERSHAVYPGAMRNEAIVDKGADGPSCSDLLSS